MPTIKTDLCQLGVFKIPTDFRLRGEKYLTTIIVPPDDNWQPLNFFQVLTKRRIALLKALHNHGFSSMRELSQLSKKDYKNVYQDLQFLKKARLIHQDAAKKIYVPQDKIKAKIPLAA